MIEYEINPPGKLDLGLKEMWTYRELFYFFTWRDIKVKYKQTLLGFTWAILQPVLLMIIFTIFFGRALNVPSEGIPYPVFVFAGLLLWNIFSSGLSSAANSMASYANVIKKVYFPRIIIPISSILVALFDFIMAFVIYLVILLIFQHPLSLTIFIFLPASLVIITLATFGLGTFTAALNVKYRDFRFIIPFMIQVLFFMTPVIYPVKQLDYEWAKILLSLNPMTSAIELFRSTVTHQTPDIIIIIPGIIMAIIFAIGGFIYFKRTEYYFADLV